MYLPSGGTVDFRLLPLLLISVYMVIQAHSKPYVVRSDNALEQCVLMALVLTIFADITLGQQISLDHQYFHLKHAIILFTTIGTIALVFFHKRANRQAAQLATVGLNVTKKVFVDHHHISFYEMVRQAFCSQLRNDDGSTTTGDSDDKDVSSDDKAIIRAASDECGMEPKKVKMYLAAFRIIDSDLSGSIDASELGALLAITTTKHTQGGVSDIKAEIEVLMNEFDDDHSGTLQFPEALMMLLARQHRLIVKDEITEAFILLADGAEQITKDSLRNNGVENVDEMMEAMAGQSGGDEVSEGQFQAALMAINGPGTMPPAVRRRRAEQALIEESEEPVENPLFA